MLHVVVIVLIAWGGASMLLCGLLSALITHGKRRSQLLVLAEAGQPRPVGWRTHRDRTEQLTASR